MSVRSLTISFCFSLLLSVVSMLAPMYASATCCGCGKCYMKYYTNPPCYCPGENGCSTCLSDESDSFQISGSAHKDMDSSTVPVNLASPILQSKVAVRVINSNICFRERVALGLLGNSRDSLKFEPLRFDGELLSALYRGTEN